MSARDIDPDDMAIPQNRFNKFLNGSAPDQKKFHTILDWLISKWKAGPGQDEDLAAEEDADDGDWFGVLEMEEAPHIDMWKTWLKEFQESVSCLDDKGLPLGDEKPAGADGDHVATESFDAFGALLRRLAATKLGKDIKDF